MASIWKYLIPVDFMSFSDIKSAREKAINAGISAAIKSGAISSADHCVVREADPVVDFLAGVGGWLTMTLAVVGTPVSVFSSAVPAALNPTLANNRFAVFYSVSVEDFPFPVTQLSFREGVQAGTTYAVFDLESLTTVNQQVGFFSEPVPYEPQRVLNIVVTPRLATAAQARVRLGCYIIEPGGPVISG